MAAKRWQNVFKRSKQRRNSGETAASSGVRRFGPVSARLTGQGAVGALRTGETAASPGVTISSSALTCLAASKRRNGMLARRPFGRTSGAGRPFGIPPAERGPTRGREAAAVIPRLAAGGVRSADLRPLCRGERGERGERVASPPVRRRRGLDVRVRARARTRVHACVCVCMCVHVCVYARARARACVRACVYLDLGLSRKSKQRSRAKRSKRSKRRRPCPPLRPIGRATRDCLTALKVVKQGDPCGLLDWSKGPADAARRTGPAPAGREPFQQAVAGGKAPPQDNPTGGPAGPLVDGRCLTCLAGLAAI